MNHQL